MSLKKIRRFVNKLGKREHSETVHNPYRGVPAHRENLYHYLKWHYENSSSVLLVGEAPGFAGCRLTGIPFSSGELLTSSEHKLIADIRPSLKLKQLEGERTATMVWNALEQYDTTPIFWNSFPFHPHPVSSPRKNRAPRKTEIDEGAQYLRDLYEIFQPTSISAIGRSGQKALQTVFDSEVTYIRHPSYGGKNDFLRGLKQLLEE